MEIIAKALRDEFELDIQNQYENLYAANSVIFVAISTPHEGNDYKYLVRFSTVAAFDRWANSCAIEKKFDAATDVVAYLKRKKTEIYINLLKYLSDEYQDLHEEFVLECCN